VLLECKIEHFLKKNYFKWQCALQTKLKANVWHEEKLTILRVNSGEKESYQEVPCVQVTQTPMVPIIVEPGSSHR
jgi:hypothetical protein